jgi:hypothetical protein
MIESVSQQGMSPLSEPLSTGSIVPSAANDRAGWWTAAPAGSDVRIAANDTDLTGRAQTNALLADDVYRAEPSPPAGYRVASADDLDQLGITPEMLEQPGSSFRARVYATGAGETTEYVVAFRGSSTGEDWRNNVQQALGLNSESYAKALEIGRQVARSDENVTFTGHSLGGGLASAAAVASGREADTFNAAGLSDDTIDTARGIATANGRGVSTVQAYHVPGEILHLVQEGGDRAAGFLLGGIVGGLLADAPEAYGTQHALPDVRPEGKNFFDGLNPIDRHGMDWVIAGTAALN